MIQHRPWQFFICQFTADDRKHTVSIGTESQEDGIESIKEMYNNVRDLRIIPRENQ
jgi:hypothetical protein